MKRQLKAVQAGAMAFILSFLAGCETNKEPLVGTRREVLDLTSTLVKDVDADNINVSISESVVNTEWTQADFNAQNRLPHVDGGRAMNKLWRQSIGSGNTGQSFLLAVPLIQGDWLYALDSQGRVSALHSKTGSKKWSYQMKAEKGTDCSGGGTALGDNRLFVTTSSAHVVALDAETGQLLWKRELPHPLRSAPTHHQGRIYVVSKNNHAFCLDAVTGKIYWHQEGAEHACALLGGSNPAVQNEAAIIPYASGEIYALRRENGFPLWAEALSSMKLFSSSSFMSHIKAAPVIAEGCVYTVTQNGRLVCIDLRTGGILWEKEIKGVDTPFVDTDFMYVVTADYGVVCLTKDSGKIIWITHLPLSEKQSIAAGPLLVNKQIVVTTSAGYMHFLKAETGEITNTVKLGGPTYLPPVVADRVLYVLLDNGTIEAYE